MMTAVPPAQAGGAVNVTVEYLGKVGGRWVVVPATAGSQIKGPCSRADLLKQHAGIDIKAMYAPGGPPKADGWNMESFLKAAEACHKAGVPFGIGYGQTSAYKPRTRVNDRSLADNIGQNTRTILGDPWL